MKIFWKNSDTIIGIQIKLSHNWKGIGDIFLTKLKISYNMTDKVRKIHGKNLKIEFFLVIFTDTMVGIQIKLECN